MAEDKLIKSGQFTLPRLLFLAASFALIVGFVALGGKFLTIGYLLLTLVICVLLFLIAIDYGINLDKVDTTSQAQPQVENLESPISASSLPTASSIQQPVRRRTSRQPKRRR